MFRDSGLPARGPPHSDCTTIVSQARTDCATARLAALNANPNDPSVIRLLRLRLPAPQSRGPRANAPATSAHCTPSAHAPSALLPGTSEERFHWPPDPKVVQRLLPPLLERTKNRWNSTLSVSFRFLHSSADELAWNCALAVRMRCQVLYSATQNSFIHFSDVFVDKITELLDEILEL